jgi:hypothetical protein
VAKEAVFQIELKLRMMASNILSLARIFAVYDCCRVPLRNFSGLMAGRGTGQQGGDSFEEEEDALNRYFHIQACAPNGIADADGGFAKRVLDCCVKYSARSPDQGYMHWPSDFAKVKWKPGEMHTEGGDAYLMPFGPSTTKN